MPGEAELSGIEPESSLAKSAVGVQDPLTGRRPGCKDKTARGVIDLERHPIEVRGLAAACSWWTSPGPTSVPRAPMFTHRVYEDNDII